MDTQASFEGVATDAMPDDLPEDSKVKLLVTKLIERQKEIEAQ